MPETLLNTEQLGLVMNDTVLLDDITLSVHTGRTLAILGANGAGKSLLLRLLHGLINPTSGHVSIKGRPLDRAARDRQAMVFQRPIMLRRSVRQNLAFTAKARGLATDQQAQRIDELLALARLTDKQHQAARSLSGGEQQRLALARALTARPELLFLDEATANLDPASTAACEDIVSAARADGLTVVCVTHDVHQTRRMADDILFLHQGRVAEFGDAQTLLDAPASSAMQDWLAGRLPRDSSD